MSNLEDAARAAIRDARRKMLAPLESIGIRPTEYDDLARREWPHMPLQISRVYAEEFVRTGRRP